MIKWHMILISITGFSLKSNSLGCGTLGPICGPGGLTLAVETVITEEGIPPVYMRLLTYHPGI